MSRTPGHKGFPFPSLTRIFGKFEILVSISQLRLCLFFLVFYILQGFENIAVKEMINIKSVEFLESVYKSNDYRRLFSNII